MRDCVCNNTACVYTSGAFGKVFKGTLIVEEYGSPAEIEAAIKTLKG